MKILVTGSDGQLGAEIKQMAPKIDADFVFTTIDDLDITDQEKVAHFFKEHSFDYCINCAAYTAVDQAEKEIEFARLVNIKGVQYIAEACNDQDVTLIHISTDYVYHNEVNRPIIESDPTTPVGIYASSKLQGDFAAMSYNEKTIVLRTSWVYSSFAHNFVKTMIRLGKTKKEINVVYDQIGSPTYTLDLAKDIFNIIRQNEKGEPCYGVFNYSNEGVTTWYDFAIAIFQMKKIKCKVNPILSKDYPTAAERPNYSVLDKTKIKQTFQLSLPHWRDSLHDCLNLL